MTTTNTIRKGLLTALAAGAMLLPAEAEAQAPNQSTTINAATEAGAIHGTKSDLTFLRAQGTLTAPTYGINVVHDINMGEKHDVLNIGATKKLNDRWGLGSAIYRVGDKERDSEYLLEAYATMSAGDVDALLDIGRSVSGPQDNLRWIIGSLGYKQTRAQAGILHNENTKNSALYGNASIGDDRRFVGVGHADGKNVALGMLAGDELANLTFASHTPETGAWSVRSQTGFGEPNRGFYSQATANFALQYLSIPPFQPVHFSPFTSKGDWSALIAGRGDHESSHIEALIGKDLGLIRLGAGLSRTSDEDGSVIGIPLQAYAPINIGKVQLGLEGAIDATTGDGSAYLTAKVKVR